MGQAIKNLLTFATITPSIFRVLMMRESYLLSNPSRIFTKQFSRFQLLSERDGQVDGRHPRRWRIVGVSNSFQDRFTRSKAKDIPFP